MKFINLLLEDGNKLEVIRKAILEKLPLTINYSGPPNEVRNGLRIDILPIVLGKNIKSGNPVIWAYVFKGVSKKGIPNWKMFRIDRIQSAKINQTLSSFNLDEIPGYIEGKAPSVMKSLSSVDIFSPYWEENQPEREYEMMPQSQSTQQDTPTPEIQPTPQDTPTTDDQPTPEVQPSSEPETIVKPTISNKNHGLDVYNEMLPKIKDVDGVKTISTTDYENAINDIYRKKDNEFKQYQKMISGNVRPGEGTRQRFRNTSKIEFDKILKTNNVNVENMLSEIYKKFKRLIK